MVKNGNIIYLSEVILKKENGIGTEIDPEGRRPYLVISVDKEHFYVLSMSGKKPIPDRLCHAYPIENPQHSKYQTSYIELLNIYQRDLKMDIPIDRSIWSKNYLQVLEELVLIQEVTADPDEFWPLVEADVRRQIKLLEQIKNTHKKVKSFNL